MTHIVAKKEWKSFCCEVRFLAECAEQEIAVNLKNNRISHNDCVWIVHNTLFAHSCHHDAQLLF